MKPDSARSQHVFFSILFHSHLRGEEIYIGASRFLCSRAAPPETGYLLEDSKPLHRYEEVSILDEKSRDAVVEHSWQRTRFASPAGNDKAKLLGEVYLESLVWL